MHVVEYWKWSQVSQVSRFLKFIELRHPKNNRAHSSDECVETAVESPNSLFSFRAIWDAPKPHPSKTIGFCKVEGLPTKQSHFCSAVLVAAPSLNGNISVIKGVTFYHMHFGTLFYVFFSVQEVVLGDGELVFDVFRLKQFGQTSPPTYLKLSSNGLLRKKLELIFV